MAVCYRELREGIDIKDREGNELGKSKVHIFKLMNHHGI